jgi:hypothetical protein
VHRPRLSSSPQTRIRGRFVCEPYIVRAAPFVPLRRIPHSGLPPREGESRSRECGEATEVRIGSRIGRRSVPARVSRHRIPQHERIGPMARRPNYGAEKRQKELKRQQKQAEKAERKLQKREAELAGTAEAGEGEGEGMDEDTDGFGSEPEGEGDPARQGGDSEI